MPVPTIQRPVTSRPGVVTSLAALAVAALAVTALAACGDRAAPAASGSASGSASGPDGGALRVESAWVRTADSGLMSAAYVTLENRDSVPVPVVGAESDVARAVELHETLQEEGMTRMQRRDTLVVPADGQLQMAPGGVHVMLIGLVRTLAAGDTVALSLRLADGRTVPVRAPVRAP